MPARISLVACLALSVVLAGCGRRGPLEPPPGAPPGRPVAATVAPTANAATPGGLFRNTTSRTDEPAAAQATQSAADSTPFVLDPLL